MSTSFMPLVNCSFNNERPSIRCSNYENLKNSPTFMPWSRALRQARDHLRINVSKIVKNTGEKIMDAFVDSVFEFVDQPLLPSQRVPGTGELVMMGMDLVKPFYELGIISADGMKLLHRVDLKYRRCTLCHDMGVTERYNVFLDIPLTLDIVRLFRGDQLVKYDKESYARIGVMPRYGDTDSIKWFEVTTNCTFHIINCFEDGDDEVVVWGCRTLESVIPGPGNSGPSIEKFNASIRDGLLHDRPYEWRLNMRTGQVKEKFLAAEEESSMDFPFINENFTGLKNKFAYTHVIDTSGIACGDFLPKFAGLAKLHFQQHDDISPTRREMDLVAKDEYHMFEDNTFFSGATFIPKQGSLEEDDGWIITFVRNEDTNISHVYIIDTKKFSSEPITKIELPYRVPYGFHGAFIPRKQTT